MQIFAKTDIGKERKLNEDYFYASKPEDKIKLFILADGMGGYNGGEVASKMAVESAKDYITKHFKENKDSKEKIENMLREATKYADSIVYKKSQSKKDLSGMGTTLDICLIYNSRIYISHIGDSRVYRIRKDFIRRLTRDDSYVQTLVDDGTITKEEAWHHPKKNMLTKALGCTPDVEPEIYTKTFIKDDIILMTSDGLTNMVPESEIYTRMLFEFTKKLKVRASIPFHILLEEAHRYVQNDNDSYLIGYNIFDRVAKEGRKYGLVFNLISQRPVEISETVISQCSNFLIFKMNHPRDLDYIKKMLPNINAEIVEKQKSLQPGTCVAFGKAFKVPMVIKMDKPNPEPQSSNCDVFERWK